MRIVTITFHDFDIETGAIANRERLGDELLSTLEARSNHLTQLL